MRALHVFLFVSLLAVCACTPFRELFKFRTSSERRDGDTNCPSDMAGKNCRCFRRGRSFQMRCRGFGEEDPLFKSSTEDLTRKSNASSTSSAGSSEISGFADGTFFNPIRGIMSAFLPGFMSPFGPPPQARQPPPPPAHHFFHWPSAFGVLISHHDDVKPGESKSSNATATTTTTEASKAKPDTISKKL